MEIGATEKIANFIIETDYEHIPKEAIAIAKNAILDYLGVTVAGSNEPVVGIMAEQVRQMGAADEAGIVGQNFRTSSDLAAWINGTASHALDYDDTFPAPVVGYNLHPTVAVLPAVLALGEKYEVSGSDILTAYIVGIEVIFRAGASIGRYTSEVGWHPTPILGTIGAVAASAKILKLNAWQIQMALGIASSLAGGLSRNYGTMTKPLHAGNAARNGVVAALLARDGFTANPGILEGEFSFYNMFSGGKVTEPTNEEQDLGNNWNIISKGIAFKPYPCCRGAHSSVDSMLHLRSEYKIRTDEVAAIVCKTSPLMYWVLRYHQPKTGLEGKFSLEYCVAVALLRGKVSLGDFTNEKVNEAEVQDLIPQVSYLHPKDWPTGHDLTQEVVVKLKNGTEYSHKVTLPKGEPMNPMGYEELSAKFRDCVRVSLPQTEIEQVLEMVKNLESLDSIARLMGILMHKSKQCSLS